MVVVVNRLRVPPQARERLEEGFHHASGMKDVPGCVGFELWRGSTEPGEYDVVTHWRSQADYDAWRASDAFRHAHRDTSGMELNRSELLVYEVLIGGRP